MTMRASTDGPALALLELCSIARGMKACDAMVKRASVTVNFAAPVHPGKYVIIIGGGVDEVAESLKSGRMIAGDTLVDHLWLPNPHVQLIDVLDAPRSPHFDSIGVFEALSVASVIRAADAALKRAEVEACSMRLADDLGGKGYFLFSGALHDVEAAMEAATRAAGVGLMVSNEIIANPDPQFLETLR